MKTLSNHFILFDAECPICSRYTKAFVSTGLLDANGRTAYQDFDGQTCPMLDRQRAINEIALVNRETGEVIYGVESLFKILSTSLPILRTVFDFKPFLWLMTKAYAFVSYNRRVIMPAPIAYDKSVWQPSFKLHYRIAYLIFTWALASFILSRYGKLLTEFMPQVPRYLEYLVCGALILFQGLIARLFFKHKKWDYLGNLMTISFAGALLLLPGLLIARFIPLNPAVYLAWFAVVVTWMFVEHIRRSRLLALGWTATISWGAYHVIVLSIILLLL
jgi:predicted DCC family thiol-disulfide oxidoreductase YuxK